MNRYIWKKRGTLPLTRRQFLGYTATLGASLCISNPLLRAAGPDKVTWVSPRGNLEVMDDFNLWVAQKMGYFKEMNLDVTLQPGPTEALAVTKLVGEKQADIGFPSPGVLLSSVDAGIPVILVWEMAMKQVFDFALPADSPITRVQELAGKTIALGSEGWRVIVDPILVEAGVDPKHVTYLNAGPQWGQAVVLGRADAGLTWRGLAAQWMALGLKLKFLVGTEFSGHPSNGYAIRREDLEHDARIDIWRRFFRANCMAFEFTRANPRTAAQITYTEFPALREQVPPQLALDSMLELGTIYFDGARIGKGYGYSNLESWQSYIDTVYELGQTQKHYKAEDVVINFFVEAANHFDRERVREEGKAFNLKDEFQDLEIRYPV